MKHEVHQEQQVEQEEQQKEREENLELWHACFFLKCSSRIQNLQQNEKKNLLLLKNFLENQNVHDNQNSDLLQRKQVNLLWNLPTEPEDLCHNQEPMKPFTELETETSK